MARICAKSCLFFFSLLLLVAFFSCDISGENTDIAEEIKIAQTVLIDFRQVKVKKGRPQYEVKASRGETFEKENTMKAYDLKFTQFDKEFKVASDGVSKKVEYNSGNENATLEGETRFTSYSEKVTLESNWLNWNNEKKTLSGQRDIPVRLQKEDGTVLEGKGFSAVTDTKTVSFTNGMKGVFVPQTDEEEENK